MADFAPPTGPPPPKLPEGWKAVWNDQYSEWFYVNIYTKKSQWDKPTEPMYPPGEAPLDAPPSYNPNETRPTPTDEKRKSGLGSNNPFSGGEAGAGSSHQISEDEKLARQLQEEEDSRARQGGNAPVTGTKGAADSYYQDPSAAYQQAGTPQPGYGYPQQSYPDQSTMTDTKGKGKGGFLGKLLGKTSGSKHSGQPQPQYGYPQQGYGPPPGAPYGQQPYGAPYGQPGGYYGGGYAQPGKKPGKQGMGAGGAAALGLGGGLLGGALLGEAIADHGGDHGGDYGGDGGDFGGDGGDFGGDGGDFGGGDFGGGDF